MTSRMKTVLLVVLTFVLGLAAGIGLGTTYGRSTANTALRQQVADLQAQYQTANDNYMVVVREYNKLFGLKTVAAMPVSAAAPAASAPAAAAAPAVKPAAEPAAKATTEPAVEATTAVTETATSEAPTTDATPESGATPDANTPEPAAGASDSAAPLVAEFEGSAIDGTGPQEGPPPLKVKFTDHSTGDITSWEWTFGDGETSTEQNPEHTYAACPSPDELCTVKLKVCGPSGCVETTKEEYIYVSETCTGC